VQERRSLEDLRAVLAESKLISNVSPSLAKVSGLRPDALTLTYAPDSSLPIVIGATQIASKDQEFELFMDVSKRRHAATASRRRERAKPTKLPDIGGGVISPIGHSPIPEQHGRREPSDDFLSFPEIPNRPGSSSSGRRPDSAHSQRERAQRRGSNVPQL